MYQKREGFDCLYSRWRDHKSNQTPFLLCQYAIWILRILNPIPSPVNCSFFCCYWSYFVAVILIPILLLLPATASTRNKEQMLSSRSWIHSHSLVLRRSDRSQYFQHVVLKDLYTDILKQLHTTTKMMPETSFTSTKTVSLHYLSEQVARVKRK